MENSVYIVIYVIAYSSMLHSSNFNNCICCFRVVDMYVFVIDSGTDTWEEHC